MYRVEIISNLSLEFDLHEHINRIENDFGENIYYSQIYDVHGKGRKGKKQGDGVWPGENFILIIYTEKLIVIERLRSIVDILKQEYPTEGIKFFIIGN
ncbi:PG0541 family transporter-associated protein [Borrelia sp. HM]|uniref:PG0541 family transporter-associated protein n=1 Tax=Borrelia sp. HM TaxID=1882662 RepID=UPI001C74745F|nr:PG0541 family transporter-associated protein [Borrelia sp. HM]BCR21582.1 hypothetical protein BKFM_00144 [Borrelia sp. HM]